MATLKLFSVFDKQVGAYMPMFPARTRGEALRMVEDAVRDPNGQFAKHLPDYTLYEIGTFDDGPGLFVQDANGPVLVVHLTEFAPQ